MRTVALRTPRFLLSASEGQLHGETQHRGLTVDKESSELRAWRVGDPAQLRLSLSSPSHGTGRAVFPKALSLVSLWGSQG